LENEIRDSLNRDDVTSEPERARRKRRFVAAATILALVGPGVMVMLADTMPEVSSLPRQSGAKYRYVRWYSPSCC